MRDWGPPFHDEDAAYFVGINRNKRSIGLDLASEGGRAVLMKMLESADVLIENFKPGTLDKWGIGNDVLRAKFPRLVHCRISGFGADGPRGGNPGYDAIIQAMTGMIAATGSPQSGPMRIGVPRGRHHHRALRRDRHPDGAVGAAEIRPRAVPRDHAVRNRPRRHASACGELFHARQAAGSSPATSIPTSCLMRSSRPATDDIFIGVGNDGTFRKLCKEIGKPELGTDPRFARNQDRIANRDALRAELAAVFSRARRRARCATACSPPACRPGRCSRSTRR